EPIDVEPIAEPGPEVTTEPTETTTPPDDTTPSLVAADTKFEIKSGEYLSTVAKNLQSKGLIADSAAFVKLVEEMKLSSKIQVGTFTIPAGATEEQIAKIITRTN
ncbi:MAG: endolytic transglycosylase MltG, partial [Firmicutes bacterium]|nr:endolytic transglycosylase MltG [Bacillota bacterium]